jgi:hypothetical protein
MLNDTICLNAKVRHVEGGRIGTVIGHVLTDGGAWLHLVEVKIGNYTARTWFGRSVLVEVE